MKIRHLRSLLLAAATMVVTAGCHTADATAPDANDDEQLQAVVEEADAQVPFVLKLDGTNLSANIVELTATMISARGVNAPTNIAVDLPPGASLVEGQPEEVLKAMPKGVTVRTFKVALTTPLTDARAVKVKVSMRDPAGAFGAFAERSFPAAKAAIVHKTAVPAPPVRRPGGGVAPTRHPGEQLRMPTRR